MDIVDTHLHLVYLDRFSYPWLAGEPAINRDFDLAGYREKAAALGIGKALHMEVDVAPGDIEAETAFAAGLGAPLSGAISSGRPESPDFAAHLERIAPNPRIKGLRRILHTSPDDLSTGDLFAENVGRLAAYGLTFDLCVLARQLDIGRRLVDRCPDVQFVLDHCGNPDIAGGGLDVWRDGIDAMAERANVAAKISGVIAYAGDNPTIDAIRPCVEYVVERFGWDRVVWGSDFPVCTLKADLESWVRMTHELLAGCSESEKSRLLRTNAERLYRI